MKIARVLFCGYQRDENGKDKRMIIIKRREKKILRILKMPLNWVYYWVGIRAVLNWTMGPMTQPIVVLFEMLFLVGLTCGSDC